MTEALPTPHVAFGMYPFASVAWAWDELWGAVHARAPWLPDALTRSGDVHARWNDNDCIVTHVCAWPFAAVHRNDMRLVGAFSLDLLDAEPPAHYRSVLLGTDDIPAEQRSWADAHAVANSADSLSGWHSLRAATVGPGNDWTGTVTFTNAHRDSLVALAKREAEVACIDSWSLSFIEEEEPGLVSGLHRIGTGPRIPTPAIAARKSLDEDLVDELRWAFADAVADPSTASARRALHIDGFAHLELDDYLATLSLGPTG
jgi:ABC-type phosphate/phosphonate transport system substrate-binding protein